MTAGSVVFLFVLVLASGFFSLNVQRLVSYLRVGVVEGSGHNIHHDRPELVAQAISAWMSDDRRGPLLPGIREREPLASDGNP